MGIPQLTEHDEDEGNGQVEANVNPIAEARETIEQVIAHDVEFGQDGAVDGIRQCPAGDRIISLTDRDMRHGRKSASVLISGYKAQVAATVMYGFILMARVIKANRHDGRDLPELAEALDAQGLSPEWWAGDHAYGTLANHHSFRADNRGELVARMSRPGNGGRFTKDEFDYDFERNTLSCPAGLTVFQKRWETNSRKKGRLFEFPGEQCAACPHRERCISPKASDNRGRTVFIVDKDERVIREHLQRREQPEFRERLAKRVGVEHAIAGFAQCGGKQAQRFGQKCVGFDANLSALAYNLRRLGSLMRDAPELQTQVEAAAGRLFLCLLQLWFTASIRPNLPVWRYAVILLASASFCPPDGRRE